MPLKDKQEKKKKRQEVKFLHEREEEEPETSLHFSYSRVSPLKRINFTCIKDELSCKNLKNMVTSKGRVPAAKSTLQS